MLRFALLTTLVACSGNKPPQPTCKDAATRMVETLAEATSVTGDDLEVMSRVMRIVVDERCTQDQWAPPAIACFAKATTHAAVRSCDTHLTAEQLRLLNVAEAAVLDGPAN